MSAEAQSKPSFYPARRWGIALHVSFLILLILSVVVMVNYLSRDYFTRFHWSSRKHVELSPLTSKFLQTITNRVKVIVYYDQTEPFYSTVTSLLKEYHYANPRISLESVDYVRDAAAAQRLKTQYKLALPSATNLIIFDCEGKVFPLDGNMLTRYAMEQVPDEKDRLYRRKPVEFQGEKMFTAALIAVTNPKPLNAYFLEGHGEHPYKSNDDDYGFLKFSALVQQNYVQTQPLYLVGTNAVPLDCHLLVIAGPRTPIPELELERIDQYLKEGGRLLVLFNFLSVDKPTGLEKILVKWGVDVGNNVIRDPDNAYAGRDIIVADFSKHPLVNSLLNMRLHLIEPRSINKLKSLAPAPDAPQVEEVAFSGEKAFVRDDLLHRQRFPLIAVVEKGAIKGVITERGSTRIAVAGDSFFLANHQIDSAANRDFAVYAVNWLLARTQFLEGLGPRPIEEYRLVMTPIQLRQLQWIMLGAMPATALLLGGLVWLRRRR